MRLTHALRLQPGMSVAFVGAGGKSSALAVAARELEGSCPVILTTSTKIFDFQHTFARAHHQVSHAEQLQDLDEWLNEASSIMLTGTHSPEEPKWLGLSLPLLARVQAYAREHDVVLAIEADGARTLPLKAPAEHEPVIPQGVDLVVALAGLDVLGHPLNAEHVHRSHLAAGLIDVEEGISIEPDHVAALIRHPRGGMKGIPSQAEVRVFLNKAETQQRRRAARRIAAALQAFEGVDAVLVGSLQNPDPIQAVYARVAGMVLAAGGSRRLDQPKQLIEWKGHPLVWHAATAALEGGLDPVVVVTGCEAARVRDAVADLPVEFVHNPDWEAGQSTSFKRGLAATQARVNAVVAMLADMPFVDAAVVQSVLARYRETMAPLVAPSVQGRRANPALFDRVTFKDLAEIVGDRGGRVLFDRFDAAWVPWDERIRFDVDTPEDLEWLQTQT